MFLFMFLVVLMIFTTVATSLYHYFQALCQVLASYDKGRKSCDMLSRKQILSAWRKKSKQITSSSFELNWLHSMLYTIVKLSYVLSFLIWVAEVPRKNSLLPDVLFFTDSSMFCLSLLLQTLSLLFLCKNLLEILRNSSSAIIYLYPVGKIILLRVLTSLISLWWVMYEGTFQVCDGRWWKKI